MLPWKWAGISEVQVILEKIQKTISRNLGLKFYRNILHSFSTICPKHSALNSDATHKLGPIPDTLCNMEALLLFSVSE